MNLRTGLSLCSVTALALGSLGCDHSPTATVRQLALQEIVELGTITDSAGRQSPFIPVSINQDGQIAGNSISWYAAGVWKVGQITPLRQGSAVVRDINDAGQVVGFVPTSVGPPYYGAAGQPFIGTPGHLQFLPIEAPAVAEGLSEDGVVVGFTGYPFEPGQVFVWDNGSTRYLEIPGWSSGAALNVNSRGAVLAQGVRLTCLDTAQGRVCEVLNDAVVFDGGSVIEIGRLQWDALRNGESSVPEFGYASASDMNDQGEVVGTDGVAICVREGQECYEKTRAFLWENGRTRDLGTLPGYENSGAIAINDHRQIVGVASTPGPDWETRYFLWEQGRMHDISAAAAELGWKLLHISDINNAGRITGSGQRIASGENAPPGPIHGLLLIPAP